MFHYIINPSTNKKISLYSSEGKQLLKKYVQLEINQHLKIQ